MYDPVKWLNYSDFMFFFAGKSSIDGPGCWVLEVIELRHVASN